jgi:hypothetical protein
MQHKFTTATLASARQIQPISYVTTILLGQFHKKLRTLFSRNKATPYNWILLNSVLPVSSNIYGKYFGLHMLTLTTILHHKGLKHISGYTLTSMNVELTEIFFK